MPVSKVPVSNQMTRGSVKSWIRRGLMQMKACLADGGVRSGLDVVRMLALGASCVLLGRAWAFALAADGERGVRHVLDLIESEMRVAMALTGVTGVDRIGPETLAA